MIPHLLQGEAWERFQQALGASVLRIPTPNHRSLGLIEVSHGTLGKLFKRLYVPYGPIVTSKKQLETALKEIEVEARSNGCAVVRVEPIGKGFDQDVMSNWGYTLKSRSSQPTVTSIVQLNNKTADEIVASMNATNRNLWRKNLSLGDEGVRFRHVKRAEEIPVFLEMMHETSRRTGAVFHDDAYFKQLIESLGPTDEAGVCIAHVEGSDVASALYVIDINAKVMYYLHAGSVEAARKHNAGNVLVSHLIIYAKQLGMDRVDLFGVAPIEAPATHPLHGISRFKRAYGGVDITYNGTWEKSLTRTHKFAMRAKSVLKRGAK